MRYFLLSVTELISVYFSKKFTFNCRRTVIIKISLTLCLSCKTIHAVHAIHITTLLEKTQRDTKRRISRLILIEHERCFDPYTFHTRLSQKAISRYLGHYT